jgi:molybdate transport system ATP-binding protein
MLDHVTFRAYGKPALPDTTWTIAQSEVWAILGPNGSGKSTLVQGLRGALPVIEGRLAYGFDVDARPVHAQIATVGFAEVSRRLADSMPFHQARWTQGLPDSSERVSDLLSAPSARIIEQLGLAPLLYRTLRALSDGERRRVLLAQALLNAPRILVLDNPLTGLDHRSRNRVGEALRALVREGLSIVVVVTEAQDIPEIVTHVAELDSGRLLRAGPRRAATAPETRGIWPVASAAAAAPGGRPVVIQMTDVNIAYQGAAILERVSWTVREGERWALIGPNGAGKTTLLGLIMGDHPQVYANHVQVFGMQRGDGSTLWELKRLIGWAAPELHLSYPRSVSCADVVYSGLVDSIGVHAARGAAQRQAVDEWLERLGLARVADRPFGALAESEQRLALVARALVKRPRLLILDEPCQGLDAAHRGTVLDAIEELIGDPGLTTIYVSHEARAMPRGLTHVLQIEEGRVVAQGPTLDAGRAATPERPPTP